MNSARSLDPESIPNLIHSPEFPSVLSDQPLRLNPHHPLSYSDSYDDGCFFLYHTNSEKSEVR
jgi:hypothetical protein